MEKGACGDISANGFTLHISRQIKYEISSECH